ncbi:MAG: CoA transferase [Ornithinimicrobium sp.]|uniref:CaiB/BaiF CoA transferase family protein n=1 Tax=Ornithinimicrobium sp. TaxID=1977084 RepID=UPI0026DEBD99|nr:CoA transferase [Ornithinimicrobium sp.]MDO5738797.1 CoA transferase [Ornithinimicrobium sp.]
MTDHPTPTGPLRGLRVLELGNYIAAPTTGRMLADFGAEVIKVERPGRGDELRNWRLYEGTTSMLFRTLNRNKRSIVVDLRSEAGRALILDLLPHCDVLLENFRPGTLEKWGLGSAALDAANPDLVLARISAFGQTGPMSAMPGFAAVAEAYGGFRELVGEPDGPPVRVGVSIGDTIAGMQAAYGVMMLLYRRAAEAAGNPGDHSSGPPPARPLSERTVDVALNEAMLSVTESLVPDYGAYGVLRTRTGGRMEGIAPSNAYACADGRSVVIAGNGDGIYQRLMEAIGRRDLGADTHLQTNAGRWARREELDKAIGTWCGGRESTAVLDALSAVGVPAGPIYRADDLVADPQLAARDMIQRLDVSTGERMLEGVPFPGIVPVLRGRSEPIQSLGHDLGADTGAVLQEVLGWGDEQVAAYEALLIEDGN